MAKQGMIYKPDADGKMVAVGISPTSGGDGSEVAPAAPAPAPAANPKKNFDVEIFRGKRLAKKKFFWRRVHKGKIRSIGGEGFDSQAKALKDEAFDRQMVQVGQPTVKKPE